METEFMNIANVLATEKEKQAGEGK